MILRKSKYGLGQRTNKTDLRSKMLADELLLLLTMFRSSLLAARSSLNCGREIGKGGAASVQMEGAARVASGGGGPTGLAFPGLAELAFPRAWTCSYQYTSSGLAGFGPDHFSQKNGNCYIQLMNTVDEYSFFPMLVVVRLATNYEKISRRVTATILLSKHISCIAIDKLLIGMDEYILLLSACI